MPDKSRVPQKVPEFSKYMVVTDNHLNKTPPGGMVNWQRLGLTQKNADDWHAFRQKSDALYKKHSDPAARTKVVNKDMQSLINAFKEFSRGVLNKIAGSEDAVSDDAITFNVVLAGKRRKPGVRDTPLEEGVVVASEQIGGGEIMFIFRTGAHKGRAAKPPGSDSVEVAFKIGGPQPETADQLPGRILSTSARFVYAFGTAAIGQYVYFAVRWYNTRHPKLAGPWSIVMRTMIA